MYYELTDIFIEKVEKQVYKQPEYYFWTYKRFKHRNKQEKSKTHTDGNVEYSISTIKAKK